MYCHETESYASVWDAIADTPEEAANLRVRSELMDKLIALVEKNGWPQLEAAQRCGVTQPRISDLLRGRISRFSLDALANIATGLGCRVHVELEIA
ncbi:helix-turn-helix domain-containing protein [Sulfuriferula sp.]|uniref:helix-turn-helix domain-containing protein n=1 Tax=Sulfuriferula sp. TaxID=2025307 RepID=UPI002731FDEF|nr:XRE family transcriptional regulator [Sulfuriferula sp.]MDP2027626.1 XRE family transcriptional regulator [Sulfuriferula sp.]